MNNSSKSNILPLLSKTPNNKNEITLLLNHDLHQFINTGGDNNSDDVLNNILGFFKKYEIWSDSQNITKKIVNADFDRRKVAYDDISPVLTFYDIFARVSSNKIADNSKKQSEHTHISKTKKNTSDDAGSESLDSSDDSNPVKKTLEKTNKKTVKKTSVENSDNLNDLDDFNDIDNIDFGSDESDDSDELDNSDDLDESTGSNESESSDSSDSSSSIEIKKKNTKAPINLKQNKSTSTKTTKPQITSKTTKPPTKTPTKPSIKSPVKALTKKTVTKKTATNVKNNKK